MGQQFVNEDPAGAEERQQRGSHQTRRRTRGQVLVIFALSAFVFVGMCGVVVDVAWYWANTLRVQRAADAAALAGAVLLPGKVNTGADNAYLRATNEAKKNGYISGGGIAVTPMQNSLAVAGGNPRELDVSITAPVPTFFMRVFGIDSINATRTAKAEYVLPVPMGSPQNYYGVGLFIDASDTTGLKSGTPVSGDWATPEHADGANDNVFASSTTTSGSAQSWGTYGLLTAPNALPLGAPVDGIEVQVSARYSPSGNPSSSGCKVQIQLSWNGGASWAPSPASASTTITLGSSEASTTLGSATSTAAWSGHTWTRADLADGMFMVRLTFNETSCTSVRFAQVDTLQVRVSSNAGPRPVYDPTGALLAPQNFWGAMQSQGAPNIQGDAFMTKYQNRSPSTLNTVDPAQDPDSYFDPVTYYNYGIDMPPNSTGGQVWIFDPGFCAVATSQGTGESWTIGSPNGYSSAQPVSAFYDLFDTIDQPFSAGAGNVASSGSTFANSSLQDATLGGANGSGSCVGQTWHDGWWQLAGGLTGGVDGRTYRLHTHSDAANQDNTTALNAFAIWATASGGTPRVYGNGAMEAYVRLPGGQASEFYLAQIAAVHAGKTMQIDLWDPGDTGSLSASLQILQPTAGGYTPAAFTYAASVGSTASTSGCASLSRTVASATPVVTNTGGTSLFNGCWLRLTIVLDDAYAAPTPPGEPGGGWWKIRYSMGGLTTDYSTDLTTWKVQILGNPVHLIVP